MIKAEVTWLQKNDLTRLDLALHSAVNKCDSPKCNLPATASPPPLNQFSCLIFGYGYLHQIVLGLIPKFHDIVFIGTRIAAKTKIKTKFGK